MRTIPQDTRLEDAIRAAFRAQQKPSAPPEGGLEASIRAAFRSQQPADARPVGPTIVGLPSDAQPYRQETKDVPVGKQANPYGSGIGADIALGLERGFPVAKQQVGGAMSLVGGMLPFGLGSRLSRVGEQTMQEASSDLAATPEPSTFAGKLAESVPGFAGTVAAGVATGGVGGIAMGAGLAGAQQAGSVFADRYQAMKDGGASDADAWRVAAVQAGPAGVVTAATSIIPFGRYLNRASPGVAQKALGSVAERLQNTRIGRVVLDGLVEGSQEAVEEFSSMVFQAAAEADPSVVADWKRVAAAGAGGAVLGTAAGAAIDIAGRGAEASQATPSTPPGIAPESKTASSTGTPGTSESSADTTVLSRLSQPLPDPSTQSIAGTPSGLPSRLPRPADRMLPSSSSPNDTPSPTPSPAVAVAPDPALPSSSPIRGSQTEPPASPDQPQEPSPTSLERRETQPPQERAQNVPYSETSLALSSPNHTQRQPWEMTREEYEAGTVLHGTTKEFSGFVDPRTLRPGHGVTYFSDATPGRKTQAEHIAEGPFGGKLVRAKIDRTKLKRFDPRNDPRAAEIMREAGAAVDPQHGKYLDWVEYPDMGDVAPRAIKEGYTLFRVREPAVQGFSWAVADANAIEIADHRAAVETALREGRPVPPNVLADYPDLAPATPKVADATPDVAATESTPPQPPAGEPTASAGGALKPKRTRKAKPTQVAAPETALAPMLVEIQNKGNGKGYRPDLITNEQVVSARRAGLVTGSTKSPRLTDAGYRVVREYSENLRAQENARADAFDAGQLRVVEKIERGEPVTQAELDEYFDPDSDWRKMARVATPTPDAGKVKEPWEMRREEYVKQKAAVPASGGFAARANTKIATAYHRVQVEQAIAEGKIDSHPDYPELKAEGKEKEQPWAGASVDDESRWYGSRVRVMPEFRGEKEWQGTVQRVLNQGRLVEVRPDGVDTAFRIPSDRITVESVYDAPTPKAESGTDQPSQNKTSLVTDQPARLDPYRIAAEAKAAGLDQSAAYSRYVQAWGLRHLTPLELNAKEFGEIYRTASVQDYPDLAAKGQSLADRLEAKARARIKEIDQSVAKARRGARKGQRLGSAPIFDYLVPYAQIALAKSIRAVNLGQKVRVLRKYVREALKEAGIIDRKTENRVLKIARSIVKDATDKDGSFSQDRLYEVMDEAQQAFARPTKGAETKRVIAENTQPEKQPKTISEREALRLRLRGQRDAAPEIFKAGQQAGADAQEVKARSQTVRTLLKMRRLGKAEGIAEGKARLEAALDSIRLKRGTVESLQKEAAAAVRRMIPSKKRGDWYTAIRDAATPTKLAKVLNDAKAERSRIDGRESFSWIAKNATDAKLTRLFGANSEGLQAARSIARDARAYLPDLDSADLETVMLAADNIAAARYELRSAIKAANEENTATLKGKRLAAAQARKEVGDAVAASRKPLPERGETAGPKNPSLMRRWARKMYTPATFARALDGGWKTDGPITRVFKSLDDGIERKHELRRSFQIKANQITQRYGYRDIGDALGKISGTLGRATQQTIPVTLGGRRLTKGQALYIAIMDPKAKAHASGGGLFVWDNAKDAPKFSIPNDVRSAIYDQLPASDLAMVQELKRLYNETYFDEVDRVSVRLNGSHLVRQPDYMRIRRYAPGGEGAGEPRSMRHISRKHLEDAGFLKPRTGGKSPIVLGDALLELLSMAESASNVAALAEPARYAEMVMLHGDTRTKVRDVAGESANKRMEQIIYGLADQQQPADTAQKIGREVISNVAASKTSLNWKTWLRQVGGIFPLAVDMDVADWGRGLRAMFDMGLEKDLEARSGWFWNRWNGGPHSAYVGIQAIPLGADVPGSAFKDATKATLRQLRLAAINAGRMRFGESGTDIGGAYKAFKQMRSAITIGSWFDSIPARVAYAGFIAKAKKANPGWSDAKAKNWAAQQAAAAFKSTQNTSDWMHASGWQQDAAKNSMLSPFLTFSSQPAKMTNLAVTAFKRGGADRAKFAAAVAMSAGWSALVTGGAMIGRDALNRALHGEELGDEDVNNALSYAQWQFASEVMGLFPGAGEGVNFLRRAMMGNYGQSVMDTPLSDVISKLERGGTDLVQAIDRLDEPINPRTGRPRKNKNMLTAEEKFLRALEAIQSAARSAVGDPTVPFTDDLGRVIQQKR